MNRGLSARSTQIPDPKAAPTISYLNFFSAAALPARLDPGLTWAVDPDIATPYSMTYLLNIQRQLGDSTTI